MKVIYIFFIVLFFTHCSFDNKTGIWSDDSIIKPPVIKKSKNKNEQDSFFTDKQEIKKFHQLRTFKLKCAIKKSQEDYYQCMTGKNVRFENPNYVEVFKTEKPFNQTIKAQNITDINLAKDSKIFSWNHLHQNNNNNIGNIDYLYPEKNLYNSVNLKAKINSGYLLSYNGNIIFHDVSGSIYQYSPTENKKTLLYNFYSGNKKLRKFEKKLYMNIFEGNLYIADNLGYFYKIDLLNNKLIWAKNYRVPFRSEIKIYKNNLYLLNEKNILYSIFKETGDIIWQFKTKESKLNTSFVSSLIVKNDNLIILNTSGEIYSIDIASRKINWIHNTFTQEVSNNMLLFFPQPLVSDDNFLFYSSNKEFRVFDKKIGASLSKININIVLKPIVSNETVFLITKDNLVVCYNFLEKKIIWSESPLKNLKNKYGTITNVLLIKDELNIFTSDGYLTKLSKKGKTISIEKKSKSGLSSNPIVASGKMFFLDQRSKLIIY